MLIISILLTPLTLTIVFCNAILRRFRGEGYLLERLGWWGRNLPNRPIWLHGASVGECMSLKPLLKDLQTIRPILVTTTTVTARKLLERLGVTARCLMWDFWLFTFLRVWLARPCVWVTVESDIWPVMIWTLKFFNVPVMLLNARISERSMRRWLHVKPFARSVFSCISYATTTCPKRAEFLRNLGVQYVEQQPHLKYLISSETSDLTICNKYKQFCANKKVWVAASVHKGEMPFIINAMKSLAGAVTIIVPRHLKDLDAWLSTLKENNFLGERHSEFLNKSAAADTNYIIVDTIGDLTQLYKAIPTVFVGGSLIPSVGGHNIIEPGFEECHVVWGPYMRNWADIANNLKPYGTQLSSATALTPTIENLLSAESLSKNTQMKNYITHQAQALSTWRQEFASRIVTISL